VPISDRISRDQVVVCGQREIPCRTFNMEDFVGEGGLAGQPAHRLRGRDGTVRTHAKREDVMLDK